MQSGIIRSFLLALTVSLGSVPLLAHHSFATYYLEADTIEIEGDVVEFQYKNPHAWLYVDVKGDDWQGHQLRLFGGAPGQLDARGIMKSSLIIGSTITVDGFKAKDGSTNGFGAKVTFPDGRMVSLPIKKIKTRKAALVCRS
jgi:hypothetical protein